VTAILPAVFATQFSLLTGWVTLAGSLSEAELVCKRERLWSNAKGPKKTENNPKLIYILPVPGLLPVSKVGLCHTRQRGIRLNEVLSWFRQIFSFPAHQHFWF
jgi:hypothetical protein